MQFKLSHLKDGVQTRDKLKENPNINCVSNVLSHHKLQEQLQCVLA